MAIQKQDLLKRARFDDCDRVYVCSPYRGDTALNILNAKIYCKYVLYERGAKPVCPHLFYTQFLDDNDDLEREIGLNLAKSDIIRCKKLFVFLNPERYISPGMQAEIEYAQRVNVEVEFINYEKVKEFVEAHKNSDELAAGD